MLGQKILDRSFFDGPVDEIARKLIGCTLFTVFDRMRTGGRIVEAEAYDETDPAAHCHPDAWIVRRNGSDPMRLPGGHAYLYPARGWARNGQWCLNITTGKSGVGSAVLIRAMEPTHGLDIMRERRRAFYPSKKLDHPTLYKKNLCSGPGCVGNALKLNSDHNRISLLSSPFEMYLRESEPEIWVSPRVRVTAAKERKLRFVDEASEYKSYSPLRRFPYSR